MINRYDKVKITYIPNLIVGEQHQCHHNSYLFCLKNKNAKFVCGWKGITPHCIVFADGQFIDPTLNKEDDFIIFHIYSFDEISKIFAKNCCSFIPFLGNGKAVYDGTKKVTDYNNWFKNIYFELSKRILS